MDIIIICCFNCPGFGLGVSFAGSCVLFTGDYYFVVELVYSSFRFKEHLPAPVSSHLVSLAVDHVFPSLCPIARTVEPVLAHYY